MSRRLKICQKSEVNLYKMRWMSEFQGAGMSHFFLSGIIVITSSLFTTSIIDESMRSTPENTKGYVHTFHS